MLVTALTGCSSSDDTMDETPVFNGPKNRIFIGGMNKYYALDSQSGQLKWSFLVDSGTFQYSTAFYQDNVLYVGCTDSYIYALNAENGNLLWKFKTNGPIESSVFVSGTTVFVGSDDDSFYALNAATGELKWKYATGFNVSSSPIVSGETVYFGSDDGYLYALAQSTGTLKWKYYAGNIFNSSSPAIVQNSLYIGNRDGNIYNIHKDTGELIWKKQLGSSLEHSSPTVLDGYLYISDKYSLHKLEASTGNPVWQSSHPGNYSSSPYVNENAVYTSSSSGNIVASDKQSGTVKWQKTIYSNSAEPVTADAKVYIGGGGSNFIYAFSEKDGTEVWKYPVNSIVTSAPVILNKDGKLFYPSKSGGRN